MLVNSRRMREEEVVANCKVLSRNFYGGSGDNYEKSWLGLVV
jgi:hypothetical protein